MEFLQQTGLKAAELYGPNRSMTDLRIRAGITEPLATETEKKISRGIGRLQHVDDQDRVSLLKRLASAPNLNLADLETADRRRAEGLLLTIIGASRKTGLRGTELLQILRDHSSFRRELAELAELLDQRPRRDSSALRGPAGIPLSIHAHYSREEVLAAIGASTTEEPLPLQTGVYWSERHKCDILLVTLDKTAQHFSPTTRYKDYAISEILFHWESQGSTRVSSDTGQRYIHHADQGTEILLFVRMAPKDAFNRTMPYLFVGPAEYLSHKGELPMQITWRLSYPLPAGVFIDYRAAVA